MKEKMKTRRLENKNEDLIWYEWITMNMTNTDMANGETQTNGIWNSINNQSTQTYAGVITWRLKAWSLEDIKTNDPKTEDSISGSANQTQTLLHYPVYALSNIRMEILKFFRNGIIICDRPGRNRSYVWKQVFEIWVFKVRGATFPHLNDTSVFSLVWRFNYII